MSKQRRIGLTTVDNPYNCITESDKWLAYDTYNGYDTCGVLARLARTSYDLTDEENDSIIERAIDDLISADPLGIYKKEVVEV